MNSYRKVGQNHPIFEENQAKQMAIFSSRLFKVRKPRGFQYKPRLFDERKARLENYKNGEGKEGDEIRKRIRSVWSQHRSSALNTNKVLYRLLVAAGAVWAYLTFFS